MTEARKVRVQAAMLPELCHSLMECSPVPMVELEGAEHIVRYVNPAFCRLVGKGREALTEKPFAETVQEGDRCLAVLNRVYRTGESETHTESEQTEPHPAYWTYAIWAVLDATQRPVGLMMQVIETTLFHQQASEMNQKLLVSSVRQHELTETAEELNERLRVEIGQRTRAEAGLREDEEKLRALAGRLEELVAERTDELVQSEGRLRALATELNLAEQRERKRLSTELHDYLAQLLVLCRMTLAQAKRIGLPTRAEELVKETEDTLDRALTYCRTLMAELNPPVLQEQGLHAGLRWLADHMKRQELAVIVDVEGVPTPSLPEDRAILLFQSVRELLMNVSKHGELKEATVRMTNEAGLLKIIVRDENGFDLAAAAAAAVVTDNCSPLSSKFGLFSIRERMKALGGSFDIQSSPGRGTTATLTLSVAPRAEDSGLSIESAEQTIGHQRSRNNSPSNRPVHSIQSSARKQHATIRLLLVDDHTLVREGLRSLLAAYNHLEVIGEAENGTEAIELARRLDPDVVVMDINMPDMDGIEATKQLKADRPSIVIIGLSVNPTANAEQKMKAAGAVAYLTKESAADALCQVIEEATGYTSPDRQTG